jgi:exosome complex exonuclease RRP6
MDGARGGGGGGGVAEVVERLRRAVEASARARRQGEGGSRALTESSAARLRAVRRKMARATAALVGGGWDARARDDDGEEEEEEEEEASDSASDAAADAEERFRDVRDAIDARCDAIDAAVMEARGDGDGDGDGDWDEGAATTTATRRRTTRHDATLARPQESFEDAVDNRRENVAHNGSRKPVGYESYEAFATFAKRRDEYPEFILRSGPATLPTPMDEDHALQVVETVDALEELAAHLEECKEFAVDLEHHSYRSFKGFTCLMQISTRERDFVVDVLALRSHVRDALGKAFADADKLKVMHGADNDVQWLQKDFGMFVSCLFDTGQAARVLELPSKGLAYLLHHYCGIKANKRFQLADWRLRPLTKEMVEYARGDTHHLLYVHDRLKEALRARSEDSIAETLARSRDVCFKRYVPPSFDDGAYYEDLLKTDNLKELSEPQLAVYAALFDWRDRAARDADESLGYVLPRALMLRLALTVPSTTRALLAECRGEAPLVAKHAAQVADLISRAHAVGAPSFKPNGAEAPEGAVPEVVVAARPAVERDALTNELTSTAAALPAQERVLAPVSAAATTTKRKRGSMASLMGGAKSSHASASTMIPMAQIFDVWGNDAEPAVAPPVNDSTIAVDAATTNAASKASERVVERRAAREEIELPGGVRVPAPLRKVDKHLPFVIPTNEMSRADEAASARAELAARRAETMRGYESTDSDDDEDEITEEMKRDAQDFDLDASRKTFASLAKEKFGMTGTDLLFKPIEVEKKRGFNQRFKAAYDEPFKAGPKSKSFPRSGNRNTTFQN